MSTLPWPKFWEKISEADRQPLRDILSGLLRHGTILGDEGGGRDLFLIARDHLRKDVEEYFAPLGLRLVVLDEPPLLQLQPVPDECDLIAQFSQHETLIALVLWRWYDEAQLTSRTKAVLLTVNDLWQSWQTIFDRIEPPTPSALKDSLVRLRRKRLIRIDAEDPARPGDAQIEILPTLPRVIDFTGLDEWKARVTAFQSESETSTVSSPTTPTPSS